MNQKMISLALVLAMVLSTVAISLAQPLPNSGPYGYSSGPYPSGPGYYPPGPGNYPSGPGNYPSGQGNYPSGQNNYPSGNGQSSGGQSGGQSSNSGGQGDHPQSGPSSSQPQYTPQAYTGKMAANLGQGQKLSEQEIASIGGAVSGGSSGGKSGGLQTYKLVIGPQLQYWALYNGQWTKDASAVFYNQQMNTLLYNDQGQYLWSYEQYPNGYVDWQNLGYMYQGYYNFWFLGDAKGWHQTAIWGSSSGWSNVLWVYVW